MRCDGITAGTAFCVGCQFYKLPSFITSSYSCQVSGLMLSRPSKTTHPIFFFGRASKISRSLFFLNHFQNKSRPRRKLLKLSMSVCACHSLRFHEFACCMLSILVHGLHWEDGLTQNVISLTDFGANEL